MLLKMYVLLILELARIKGPAIILHVNTHREMIVKIKNFISKFRIRAQNF